MQALQKAAKEREGAVQPRAEASTASGDLTLEPLDAVPLTKSASTGAPGSGESRAPKPEQAASVLRASQGRPGILDWLVEHRKAVYAGLLGAMILGYGGYFYLSVYHPSLLRRTPAPAPVVRVPTPAAGETPAALAEPASPIAESRQSAATTSELGIDVPPARGNASARQGTAGQSEASQGIERPRGEAGYRVPVQPAQPATEPAPRRARDSISVRPGGEPPRLNPKLAEAYDALRSGRTEDARRLYDALLATEPGNVDALLGRGTIAQLQGDPESATRHFFQVLQVDPSNAIAQGAIINLIGRADPQAAESRLKSLIAKDPSGFLYFSLGNLYAEQGNWPSAQAAYFQAHHLQPDNADYLFNLAVSLEHLSQPKLALGFYRQALELARQSGRANFDSTAAQERVNRLAAGVD